MTDNEYMELARLVSEYALGTLTEADRATLMGWAAREPFVNQLLLEYDDGQSTAEKLKALDAIPLAADWDSILAKRRSGLRRKNPSWIWTGVAAAMLLFAGITWVMVSGVGDGTTIADTQYGHKNDVLPGGNRAVLTLSGGKQVVLDDRMDGRLTDESSVIDLQQGMLVYQGGSMTPSTPQVPLHKITVPVGGTYQLTLSDGTNVWLNADSKLIFPAAFPADERRVSMAGEVYFEIAKDADRPFIVEVDDLKLTALGTAFNVNGHAANGQVKTILTEGKLKVSNASGYEVLEPGFALVAHAQDMRVEAADLEEALAWKEGYFYFNQKNMAEILREVARWYGVEVKSAVNWGNKKYIGGIKRTATLGGVCALLADLSGRQFSIDGKQLTVN